MPNGKPKTMWEYWGKTPDGQTYREWFDGLSPEEQDQVELMKDVIMTTEYDALDGDAAEITYSLWKEGFRILPKS